MNRRYHYFYKITNNINGHFYYGVHNTDNLDDGYMGSGKRLRYAYEKYGIENFTKEILKFFDTSKEAFLYEAEVVNERLVNDKSCYNIKQGGDGWRTMGLVTVKDKDGNYFDVPKDDFRYISGELVSSTKYTKCVYNKETSSYVRVPIDAIEGNENLVPLNVGKIRVFDRAGNNFMVDVNDERIGTELTVWSKNRILVKDKEGNNFLVDPDDKRLISGELTLFWKGRHHTDETKEKMKNAHKVLKYQQGEKNSQYGTCWVYNNTDKQNIKIKKEQLDEFISAGWVKGRKLNF